MANRKVSDISEFSILRGCLDHLPPASSNVIRIFISSTFTDYTEERNTIMRDAIPHLKAYCERIGFELQIADMRWGVRDDIQIEHKATELCVEEVNNCRQTSAGPYFVLFLGDRYGNRSYPSKIPADEFEILLRASRTASRSTSLLDDWYKRDDNNIPAQYVLQPITSKFPYYNDESEENEEKRKKDRTEWNAINNLLKYQFRVAAEYAFKYGKFTAQQKRKYFQSVTEAEIEEGILRHKDEDKTLCFLRQFEDINPEDKLAWRFVDIDGGQIDSEPVSLLQDLKTIKLPPALAKHNIESHTIHWTPVGVDPNNPEHKSYLNTFNRQFYAKVKRQIDLHTKQMKANEFPASHMVTAEVLHHGRFCVEKCSNFSGRDETLLLIQQKLSEVFEAATVSEKERKRVHGKITNKAKGADIARDKQGDVIGDWHRNSVMRQNISRQSKRVIVMNDEEDADVLEKVHKTRKLNIENVDTDDEQSEGGVNGSVKNAEFTDDEDSDSDLNAGDPDVDADCNKPVMLKKNNVKHSVLIDKKETSREDGQTTETADTSSKSSSLSLSSLSSSSSTSAQSPVDDEPSMKDQTEMQQKAMKAVGVTMTVEDDEVNLEHIKQMALETSNLNKYTKPLIIHGISGSGKTALLAKVAQLSNSWFKGNLVKVIRFLGTSPGTSTIRDTLVGICLQISHIYKIRVQISEHELRKDFTYLCAYFTAILHQIDTETQPLLIILDSLDQLAPDDHIFSMEWLQVRLPPGVMMLLSLLPDHHGALNKVKKMLPRNRFIEVMPLPKETAATMITGWLQEDNRQITREQLQTILNGYAVCPQPLWLKIAFEEAKTWSSYSLAENWQVGISIRSAIELLFTQLERQHGRMLVSKALGYLTVARNGLTPTELEDLLSLDDDVLQDTYLYHLPPNPKHIRVPMLLWRRIQFDLRPYLTTHLADKKHVVVWYHRQFSETARKRYAKEAVAPLLHANMADYFSGKWAKVAKPLQLYKKKKGSYPEARRGVPEQPIRYSSGAFNLRKLSELPHHLIASQDFIRFATEVTRNLEFLMYKCFVASILSLLKDLSYAYEVIKTFKQLPKHTKQNHPGEKEVTFLTREMQPTNIIDDLDIDDEIEHSPLEDMDILRDEIKYLHDILLLGRDAISRDAYNLPIQIIGQLGASKHQHPGLELLRQSTLTWIKRTHVPLMVPQTQCLPTIGGDLLASIDIAIGYCGDDITNECKLATTSDGKQLHAVERSIKGDDFLHVYDITSNGSLIKRKSLIGQSVRRIALLANDKYMLVEAYKRRDKFNPKYDSTIINMDSSRPVQFPKGLTFVSMSNCGKYCLMAPRKVNTRKDSNMIHVATLLYMTDMSIQTLLVPAKANTLSLEYAIFSPNSKYVLLVCSDSRRYLMTTDQGRLKYAFGNFVNSGYQNTKHITYRNVLFAGDDRVVYPQGGYTECNNLEVFSVTKGVVLSVLKGHNYPINLICLSSDKQLVATATTDTVVVNGVQEKYIHVWDLDLLSLFSLCKGEGPYVAVTFAGKQREFLFSCSWHSSKIVTWYIGSKSNPCREGIPIYNIIGHNAYVHYILVTPSDKMIVTASQDNTVKLWSMDVVMNKCQNRLNEASKKLSSLQQLLEPLDHPYNHGEGAMETSCITVSRSGDVAAVATVDSWLVFYSLVTMEMLKYHRLEEPAVSLLTTRGGRYMVSAGNGVTIWNPNSGELIRKLGSEQICCLAEAQNILVAGEQGMESYGHVYNLDTGNKLQTLAGLYGFNQVVITSDSKKVITTMFDFPLIYDIKTGETLPGSNSDTLIAGCSCIALSRNDKLVVSCSTDGSVRVMRTDTGKYIYRMQHKSSVRTAIFTKDSQILLTAGFAKIIVWNMKNGDLMYSLSRHQDFIYQLELVCNDSYLISCSEDKEIVIWDVKQGSSLAHFFAHCPVKHITVTEDLQCLLFAPQHVAYISVLKPNDIMQKIIKGETLNRVPSPVKKAQAFALTFSDQKVLSKSSQACNIL